METKTLDIPVVLPEYYEGCERCVERLKEALLGMEGMHSVEIDEESSSLVVTFDAGSTSIQRVEERAKQIGVEIVRRYTHEVLTLEGLDCPDCAIKVEKALSRMAGVIWASVNYATSILNIEYTTGAVLHDDIVRRTRKLGYDVAERDTVIPGIARGAEAAPLWKNRRVFLTALSGLFLALGFLLSRFDAPSVVFNPIYAAALLAGGFHAARSGFYSVRSFTLDTNFLMTAAAIGAVALGDWMEGAMVLFLYSLGGTLEWYTVDKTRRSIRSLVDLFPHDALVKRNGAEQRTPIEDIRVDEVVVVKPGDRIAVDGQIVTGSSAVDQSAITGESIPVEKGIGDTVFAGSINQRGSFEVRVTSLAQDNTLSKIIHLIEDAQAQKAPSQRFSERFGRIYTPLVIAGAVALAIIPLVLGLEFTPWFRKALILLVVSCPCALVISTPVAIVAAIGNAAKHGILIKGGAYLEEMGRIGVIAFDKTGTLTSGKPQVTDVIPLNNYSEDEILSIASTIESRSEHPLAEAILARAAAIGVSPGAVTYFEAMPGKGARAVVNGRLYYIGNQRLLDDIGLKPPETEEAQSALRNGKTLMFVGIEDELMGIIAAADTVKETSAEALRKLRLNGIHRTMMLTGDNYITARIVARDLGIDEVRAELLPEEKVAAIKELVKKHGRVAMVGDGMNDAPALAAASVGIAMGGAGSHAALETADITLMADDLSKLPYSMKLSRNSLRVIKQNVAFAVIVVITLVVTTLLGRLTLAGGVIGHEASALVVIANGMRLLRTVE
ncbi:MAG: cation-translocating P-type ATPase [Armatimonadota bacterium]|nr:cation-translocating P-type ATPase [Armatimonadota bacterium]